MGESVSLSHFLLRIGHTLYSTAAETFSRLPPEPRQEYTLPRFHCSVSLSDALWLKTPPEKESSRRICEPFTCRKKSLLAGGVFKRVILTLECTFVCAAAAPRSHWHPREGIYVMYARKVFLSDRLCGHDAMVHPVTVLPRWQHCTSLSVQELNADMNLDCASPPAAGGGRWLFRVLCKDLDKVNWCR